MQKEKTVGRQCVGTQIADILEERILQNIYPVGSCLRNGSWRKSSVCRASR